MSKVPVFTVTGWSGSGKTTFMTRVVEILTAAGVSVGVIKHHGHKVLPVDTEGKDTWRYEQAGANPVVLATDVQYAVFVSTPKRRATPEELVARIEDDVDFVIVEGFHAGAAGAIEVSRKATGKGPKLSTSERLALVTDDETLAAKVRAEGKPVFGLGEHGALAQYLCDRADIPVTIRP